MRKFGLLLALFCSFCFSLKGQVNINVTVPTDTVSVCKDTFTVTVQVTNTSGGTLTGVHIIHAFPSGIQMVAVGALTNTSIFSVADSSSPEFLSATLTAGQSAIIVLQAFADCGYSGSSAADTTFVTGISPAFTATPDTTNSYNVVSGVVTATLTPSLVTLNVGDTAIRTITVCNTGAGNIPDIYFAPIPEEEALPISYVFTGTFGSFTLTGAITSVNLTPALLYSLTGDSMLADGACFTIKEYLKVIECDSGDVSSYTLYWGCGGDTCQITTLSSNIATVSGTPVITPSVAAPFVVNTYVCASAPGTAAFYYVNTATDVGGAPAGNAVATDICIYVRWGPSVSDILNVYLNGVNLATLPGVTVTPSYTPIYTDSLVKYCLSGVNWPFGSGTLTDADGDGFTDDLLSQDTFLVTVDYRLNCDSAHGTCAGVSDFVVDVQTDWHNQCGQLMFNYSLTTTQGVYFYTRSEDYGSLSILPADVTEGDTFTYRICPKFRRRYDIQPYNELCPTDSFVGIAYLPPGFFPANSPDSVDVVFIDVNDTISVPYWLSGDSIIFDFDTLSWINGGWLWYTGSVGCFEIPMILNCADTATVPNFGYDNISFEMQYICNDSCSCTDVMACTSAQTFHHCLGPCDSPIGTFDFTLERATFGWVDSLGGIESETVRNASRRLNRGDADTMGLNLKAAYPCDTVLAIVPGEVGSFPYAGLNHDSIFVQVRYFAPNVNSVFTFAGGEVHIVDGVTGNISVADLLPPTVTDSGAAPDKMYFMNFHWDHNDVDPDTLDPGDSICAFIKMRVVDVPDMNTPPYFHNFASFRGEWMTRDTLDSLWLSCDHWGDNFTLFKPRVSHYFRPGNFTTGPSRCDPYLLMLLSQVDEGYTTLGTEDFPNEFRNYFNWSDTVEIRLPHGYGYITGSSVYGWYWDSISTSIAIPDPAELLDINGDTLLRWVYDWPLTDLRGHISFQSGFHSLYFYVQPSCASPDQDDEAITASFFNRDYSLDPGCRDTSVHFRDSLFWYQFVFNDKPDLQVNEPAVIQSVQNEVSFVFELCNADASVSAPYTWLAFEIPTSNMQLAFVVNTTTGDTLNGSWYAPDSSMLLVEVDSNFAANNCDSLILVGYNVLCDTAIVTDSIYVMGWYSCTSFPSEPDSALCGDTLAVFTYTVLPSDLVLLAEVPDTTAMCDTLHYTLTLLSPMAGTISDPEFWLDLPPGVSLAGACYHYPLSAPCVPLPAPVSGYGPGGLFNGWNIDSIVLADTGLTGALDTSMNKLSIELFLVTACGYNPNDFIVFHAQGVNSCSSLLEPFFQHLPVISGLNPFDSLSISPAFLSDTLECSETDTLQFTVTQTGSGNTLNSNFLQVTVPGELNTGVITPPPASTATGGGGELIVTWAVPSLTGGGSTTFSIPVFLTDTMCDTLTAQAILWYSDSADCAFSLDPTIDYCTISDTLGPYPLTIPVCCTEACQAVAGPDTTICEGSCAELYASGGVTYSWSPSVGLSNPYSPITGVCGLDTTTCFVVTITDSSGCTDTDTMCVFVLPATTAFAGNDTLICYWDLPYAYPLGAPPVPATIYSWAAVPPASLSWLSCTSCADPIFTVPAASGFCFTYILTAQNEENKCFSEDTVTVCTGTKFGVKLDAKESWCKPCTGGATALPSPAGSYTYQWNDPLNQTTQNAINLCPGTYTVTVTDIMGCEYIDSVTVPGVNVNADAGADLTFCGQKAPWFQWGSIGGSPTAPPGALYSWTALDPIPGGIFAFGLWAPNPIIVALNTASGCVRFEVTVTDPISNCVDKDTVRVCSSPIMNVTLIVGNATWPGCCNGGIASTVTGGTPPYTYSWSSGHTTPTAFPLCTGIYTLTVIDALGCTRTAQAKVKCFHIHHEPFRPEDEPVSSGWAIAVAPNPSNGNFSLLIFNAPEGELTIEVVSTDGRVVLSQKTLATEGEAHEIRLTGVSSGMYYVRVRNGTDMKMEKVVIY